MHLPYRLLRLGCALGALAGAAFAAEPRARPGATVDDQDAVILRGLFDFQLPKLIRPESLRFTLNPLFGDIVHRDHIRFRTGFRYAFTRHFEVSAEVVPFLDNFGGHGADGFGVAEYRLGTKIGWRSLLDPIMDTALGATLAIPAPGAPEKLTIGTTRFTPYIVFSRELPGTRGLGVFLNLAYECFDSDPAPDRIPRYRPSRDNLIVTPGVVLHRAPWHYTLATAVRTTALDGGGREYFSVLPSVSYEVPERWLPFISGRVVVGAGYEAIFFRGEFEQRVTSRVRWDFDWVRAARNLGSDVLDTMPWRNGRSEKP